MKLCKETDGNAFQFFTRNPRGGKQRAMGDEEIEEGNRLRQELGVVSLVGHFPYTVNLASPKDSAYYFARETLHKDLRWGDRMGADVLVVHPGSHVGEGDEKGLSRIIKAIEFALEGYEGSTRLLLETMAGQGSEIGWRLEHLQAIFDGLGRPPALGICLDSCHLFASGWELRTPAGVAEMVQAFDQAIGKDRIGAMHLNDSKFDIATRKDRHELIGKGFLGEDGIRAVVKDPFISTLPIVLETPVEDYLDYRTEIHEVQRIIS